MKKTDIMVRVQDMHGNPMPQTCSKIKAQAMITKGEAVVVNEKPLTIRLTKPWSPKVMRKAAGPRRAERLLMT